MTKINKILIPLFFFIQYFGIGALAQVVVLLLFIVELVRGKKLKLSLVDSLLLFSVIFLFIIKLFTITLENDILMLKFYWGFIIFYLYFKISNYKFDFLIFFWLAVIITIVDFTLINTIMPLEMMKNIPKAHAEIISTEAKFLLFNRSYGLASMPTASATILVILLAGLYTFQRTDFRNFHIIITIVPLIFLGSGTGFLLFLFFVFMRFKLYKGFKFNIGVIFLVSFSYFVTTQNINNQTIFKRLSVNYFNRLIEYKSTQISDELKLLDHSFFETLFGLTYTKTMTIRIMSDFGWIDLLECYGLFGVAIFILFIVLKKKLKLLPVFILVISYFHYPALGSIPGQILFATLLLSIPKDKNTIPPLALSSEKFLPNNQDHNKHTTNNETHQII